MTSEDKVRNEMEAFRRALPDLLERHLGKWVVFVDGKVSSLHDTEQDAYGCGMTELGPEAGFVVARVSPEREQPVSYAVYFGIGT